MNLSKKKKLLFFINSYSDYLNDFVNKLSNSYEVKVFLTKKNTTFTNYNLPSKKYILINLKNFKKNIDQFSPQIILVGGFKHFLINKIIKYKNTHNVKLLLWLERLNKNFIFKRNIYSVLYRHIFDSSDGILAIGKEAYKYYRKLNKNTFLLPYNIDFKTFKKNKCKKKDINILYVGQLIERKGINEILNGLNELNYFIKKKLKITFVGNGFLKNKILLFKKKNKMPFIKLYTFLERKRLINIYRRNNIFIFPSLYDGWGVAPVEAMASRMALIISKNCGVTEFIKNKKNGIVIESNSKNISNAIEYYYKNPNNIINHGNKNFLLSKKSLLNSSIAAKTFINSIKKI